MVSVQQPIFADLIPDMLPSMTPTMNAKKESSRQITGGSSSCRTHAFGNYELPFAPFASTPITMPSSQPAGGPLHQEEGGSGEEVFVSSDLDAGLGSSSSSSSMPSPAGLLPSLAGGDTSGGLATGAKPLLSGPASLSMDFPVPGSMWLPLGGDGEEVGFDPMEIFSSQPEPAALLGEGEDVGQEAPPAAAASGLSGGHWGRGGNSSINSSSSRGFLLGQEQLGEVELVSMPDTIPLEGNLLPSSGSSSAAASAFGEGRHSNLSSDTLAGVGTAPGSGLAAISARPTATAVRSDALQLDGGFAPGSGYSTVGPASGVSGLEFESLAGEDSKGEHSGGRAGEGAGGVWGGELGEGGEGGLSALLDEMLWEMEGGEAGGLQELRVDDMMGELVGSEEAADSSKLVDRAWGLSSLAASTATATVAAGAPGAGGGDCFEEALIPQAGESQLAGGGGSLPLTMVTKHPSPRAASLQQPVLHSSLPWEQQQRWRQHQQQQHYDWQYGQQQYQQHDQHDRWQQQQQQQQHLPKAVHDGSSESSTSPRTSTSSGIRCGTPCSSSSCSDPSHISKPHVLSSPDSVHLTPGAASPPISSSLVSAKGREVWGMWEQGSAGRGGMAVKVEGETYGEGCPCGQCQAGVNRERKKEGGGNQLAAAGAEGRGVVVGGEREGGRVMDVPGHLWGEAMGAKREEEVNGEEEGGGEGKGEGGEAAALVLSTRASSGSSTRHSYVPPPSASRSLSSTSTAVMVRSSPPRKRQQLILSAILSEADRPRDLSLRLAAVVDQIATSASGSGSRGELGGLPPDAAKVVLGRASSLGSSSQGSLPSLASSPKTRLRMQYTPSPSAAAAAAAADDGKILVSEAAVTPRASVGTKRLATGGSPLAGVAGEGAGAGTGQGAGGRRGGSAKVGAKGSSRQRGEKSVRGAVVQSPQNEVAVAVAAAAGGRRLLLPGAGGMGGGVDYDVRSLVFGGSSRIGGGVFADLAVPSSRALLPVPYSGGDNGMIRSGKEAAMGLQIKEQLSALAEAYATDDQARVRFLQKRLSKRASPLGDSSQRIAHYFLAALSARETGTGYDLFSAPLTAPIQEVTRAMDLLCRTIPFVRVCHTISQESILSALGSSSSLHIIAFGIWHGDNWGALFRSLAARPGGPPRVKITGVDAPLTPGKVVMKCSLNSMGGHLEGIAQGLGVPLEYETLDCGMENFQAGMVKVEPGAVLVACCSLRMQYLPDATVVRANPRDSILRALRELKPSLLVMIEINSNFNGPFFLARFREALSFFSAIFEAIDSTLHRDSNERHCIEANYFARDIMAVVACEGLQRMVRSERGEQWQGRLERAGFSSQAIPWQTTLKVKELFGKALGHGVMNPALGRFHVQQSGDHVEVLWNERPLIWNSTWRVAS